MTQTPIQLIALDLDGTLLDSNGRISPQNENAINWNAPLVYVLTEALPAK